VYEWKRCEDGVIVQPEPDSWREHAGCRITRQPRWGLVKIEPMEPIAGLCGPTANLYPHSYPAIGWDAADVKADDIADRLGRAVAAARAVWAEPVPARGVCTACEMCACAKCAETDAETQALDRR